ncbi:MAG: acetyl-/propionyl-CoA carboxylase subunit alpha, partial [Nitrosopumilales archaeon]|nr:acetyl-/propionyl-CoA carboxylase subunit alpha [Nitrosopumilales archaeon]
MPQKEVYQNPFLEYDRHAIEARICAEDPRRGWLPATGRLRHLRWPALPGVRIDTGFRRGDEIS